VPATPSWRRCAPQNLDLAVEPVFRPTTSIHATGFVKTGRRVRDPQSRLEIYDGESYLVSRPHTTLERAVRGVEFGLPAVFASARCLARPGPEANYTYVDGATHDPLTNRTVPLQNLSRNSGT